MTTRARRSVLRSPGALLAAVYVVLTLVTAPAFPGDAWDYARNVAEHETNGESLWKDPGHLLLRPLGWILLQALGPLLRSVAPGSAMFHSLVTLELIAWIGGLAAVLGVYWWLRAAYGSERVALVGGLVILLTKSVLNFAQAGTSYVPALGALALGLALGERARLAPDETRSRLLAVPCGACLALAVLFWFPFVLAVPGALLAPVVLHGSDRRLWSHIVVAAVAGAVVGLGVALPAGFAQGFRAPGEFVAWVTTSHPFEAASGIPRAVLGLARSIVDMADYGRLVKRFMMGDPHNPVSAGDIIRPDLAKFVLVYLALFAVLVVLFRTPRGRRALLATGLALGPVLAFAVSWQGGDLERFLPAFPWLALCCGVAVAWLVAAPARVVAVGLLAAVGVVNLVALSRFRAAADASAIARRLGPLTGSLGYRDLVLVVNWQDEIVNFQRGQTWHPLNRDQRLRVYALITPGAVEVPVWKQDFARRTLETWAADGNVWLTSRGLAEKPLEQWRWFEGDDPRVHWGDFSVFSTLAFDSVSVADDGFRRIARTPENQERLGQLLAQAAQPTR